jgi:hypothetical protein
MVRPTIRCMRVETFMLPKALICRLLEACAQRGATRLLSAYDRLCAGLWQ